jgi:hypothetical protein
MIPSGKEENAQAKQQLELEALYNIPARQICAAIDDTSRAIPVCAYFSLRNNWEWIYLAAI